MILGIVFGSVLEIQVYKNSSKAEYILCAAIHILDGEIHEHQPKNVETGYVVTGWRHHNCYQTISLINQRKIRKHRDIQGFLTSKNRFLDRKEAGQLAKQCNQIDLDVY